MLSLFLCELNWLTFLIIFKKDTKSIDAMSLLKVKNTFAQWKAGVWIAKEKKKKSLHLKVCGEQNKVYLQLAITITTRALILLQPLKITI